MAQRRVAASGFGGGIGSILGAVAQGTINREERDRDVQRQAILNRLATEQADQIAQSRRLALEDQEAEAAERQRELENAQKMTEVWKQRFIEEGHDPSVAEGMALSVIETGQLPAQVDANLERTRASAASSRVTAQQRRLQNENLRDQNDALELMGDEEFSVRANSVLAAENLSPGVKERTILDIAQRRYGASPRVARMTLDMMRKQAESVQAGETTSPFGEDTGERPDSNQTELIADQLIERAGGLQQALERAQAIRDQTPEGDQKRQQEAVIAELQRRRRDREGF